MDKVSRTISVGIKNLLWNEYIIKKHSGIFSGNFEDYCKEKTKQIKENGKH